MKLYSYLPQQGARLYIAPLLNIVLLLLIFFLLGSTFVIPSGVSVKLPKSTSRLSGFERAHIITLAAADDGLYFDGLPVHAADLQKKLAQKTVVGRRVIIHADEMVPSGRLIEISNVALALGYEVAFATQPPRGLAP